MTQLFRPDVQALIYGDILRKLDDAVARSVMSVFWMVLAASILCLLMCLILPKHLSARR